MVELLKGYWWVFIVVFLALASLVSQTKSQTVCQHCGAFHARGLTSRCPECKRLPESVKRQLMGFIVLVILFALYGLYLYKVGVI